MKVNLGLDVGGNSVKFCFFDKNKELQLMSILNRVDLSLDSCDGYCVETDHEKCYVGSIGGIANQTNKKVNYKNLRHILLAVASEISRVYDNNTDITLNISTCLPPTQFKECKDIYKLQFLNMDGVKGTVNEMKLSLKIGDIKCGVEGLSLLNQYKLPEELKNASKIMLLDIGSSTSDIIALVKSNGRWRVKDAVSSKIAGSKFCSEMSIYLNHEYRGDYDWNDLSSTGVYQLNGECKSIVTLASEITPTVNQLIREIERVGSLSEYIPLVMGGASDILRENMYFKNYVKSYAVESLYKVYGNALGCLSLLSV